MDECYEDLLHAVQENNLPQVRKLVGTHGFFDLPDNGYSLLKEACKKNFTESVEYLISKKCDVNNSTDKHQPPLYHAIMNGNIKIVKTLLKRGAYVNIRNNNENTTLLNAIENGEHRILELLLDYGFHKRDFLPSCTSLHLAAFWGKNDLVEKYLAKEAPVDAKTDSGMTPIHFAAYRGHLHIVKRLISQGASVNELAYCDLRVDSILELSYSNPYDSYSPLHIAVANKHFSLVKLLLDHGANVNAPCGEKETTALYLASENSYAITKLLLSYSPDINDVNNRRALTNAIWNKSDLNTVRCLFQYGFTIHPKYVKNKRFLKAVCQLGCVEAMENLIRYGLDVNTVVDDFLGCILHLVVRNKKRDLCDFLLKCKANVNMKNGANKSPFFYAVENCDVEIAKLLLDNGADRTENIIEAFNIAIEKKGLKIVEFLFQNYGDIDINSTDDCWRQSLHCTVLKWNGYLGPPKKSDSDDVVRAKIVKLLLDKGSQINSFCVTDMGSITTLIIAACKGYNNVVQVLLENGAYPNIQSSFGLSALHAAVTFGYIDLITGVSDLYVDCIIDYKARKLDIAAKKRYTHIVELLLKYGSDCNLQDKRGLTALHLAVIVGTEEVINMLLKSGCNISLKDNYGNTAFHIACKFDLYDTLHVLLEYILSIPGTSTQNSVNLLNLKDNNGLTLLIIATVNGSQNIVETLLNSGVDVNSQDGNSETVLHHAVEKDFVGIVELLIKYGIDCDLRDKRGTNAMHCFWPLIRAIRK